MSTAQDVYAARRLRFKKERAAGRNRHLHAKRFEFHQRLRRQVAKPVRMPFLAHEAAFVFHPVDTVVSHGHTLEIQHTLVLFSAR